MTPITRAEENLTHSEFNEAIRQQVIADLAQQAAWKDGNTAKLINMLRDIAIEFHGTQQLRERIVHEVVPVIASLQAKLEQSEAQARELEKALQHIEQDSRVMRPYVGQVSRLGQIARAALNKEPGHEA